MVGFVYSIINFLYSTNIQSSAFFVKRLGDYISFDSSRRFPAVGRRFVITIDWLPTKAIVVDPVLLLNTWYEKKN